MDNQLPQQDSTSVPPQATPPSETSIPTSNNRKKILVVIVAIIVLILGGGSIYLGINTNKPTSDDSKMVKKISVSKIQVTPTLTPTSISTLTPTPMSFSHNVNTWKRVQGVNCMTIFAIPPKEESYLHPNKPVVQRTGGNDGTGRFWDFPRGVIYPNILTKIHNDQGYKQDVTMYASEQEASGEIAAAVSVSCLSDITIQTNEQLLEKIRNSLEKYNQTQKDVTMEADTYSLDNVESISKWGRDIMKLSISENFENRGGDPFTRKNIYYLFAYKNKVYEVRIVAGDYEKFVADTADKILDNLSFN